MLQQVTYPPLGLHRSVTVTPHRLLCSVSCFGSGSTPAEKARKADFTKAVRRSAYT